MEEQLRKLLLLVRGDPSEKSPRKCEAWEMSWRKVGW
jgi:hypothetical protein